MYYVLGVIAVFVVVLIIYRVLLVGSTNLDRTEVLFRFCVLLQLRHIEHSEAVGYLNRERKSMGFGTEHMGVTYTDFTTEELQAFVNRYGVGIAWDTAKEGKKYASDSEGG